MILLKRIPKNKLAFFAIILLFATSPDILFSFQDDRNLLLIIMLFIFTLFFLLRPNFEKVDSFIVAFIATLIISSLINFESFRLSTLGYTGLFVIGFLWVKQFIQLQKLPTQSYLSVIDSIIFLLVSFLFIQQIFVALNLNPPLAGNYSELDRWKLSSLAAEPSHASLIIALLFYSHLLMNKFLNGGNYSYHCLRNNIPVWLMVLWFVLTSNSASAFILFLCSLTALLSMRNVIYISLLVIIVFTFGLYNELPAFMRALNFMMAMSSLDQELILAADHSASYRILPPFLIIDQIRSFDIQFFFGNGIDSVKQFFYKIMPGTPEGYATGGVVMILYEYGLISFVFLMIYTIRLVNIKYSLSQNSEFIFLFIALFMGNGINTQMFWFFLIILYANKHYITFGIRRGIS